MEGDDSGMVDDYPLFAVALGDDVLSGVRYEDPSAAVVDVGALLVESDCCVVAAPAAFGDAFRGAEGAGEPLEGEPAVGGRLCGGSRE